MLASSKKGASVMQTFSQHHHWAYECQVLFKKLISLFSFNTLLKESFITMQMVLTHHTS